MEIQLPSYVPYRTVNTDTWLPASLSPSYSPHFPTIHITGYIPDLVHDPAVPGLVFQ